MNSHAASQCHGRFPVLEAKNSIGLDRGMNWRQSSANSHQQTAVQFGFAQFLASSQCSCWEQGLLARWEHRNCKPKLLAPTEQHPNALLRI